MSPAARKRAKPAATATEFEPLWGERPVSLTPAGEKWGIGRVVPLTPEELTPNPRWGIWDMRTGKLVFGLSGVLAIALSHDEKQIAVWREELAPTADRPFFGGTARTDFRWSFERRRWPAHKRVISTIAELRSDLIRNWPISIEFSPDDAHVTLTCRSDQGSEQVFIECVERGGDRVLDAAPPKPKPSARATAGAKTRAKNPKKPPAKPKAKAKTKPKAKAKSKSKAKARPKKNAKARPKKKTRARR